LAEGFNRPKQANAPAEAAVESRRSIGEKSTRDSSSKRIKNLQNRQSRESGHLTGAAKRRYKTDEFDARLTPEIHRTATFSWQSQACRFQNQNVLFSTPK
jgi:hypothetical protein